jgi:hypothetical protein
MTSMPIETSAMLMAVASKVGCPVMAKKTMKALSTITVTLIAAGRKCVRQKMQLITVIAM